MSHTETSPATMTFRELLIAHRRGRADDLERLIQATARDKRVEAAVVLSHVQTMESATHGELDTQSRWTVRIRAWLQHRISAASFLKQRGFRKADARRAAALGITLAEARHASHTEGQRLWDSWRQAEFAGLEDAPSDVAGRTRIVLRLVAGEHPVAAVQAWLLGVDGARDEEIAEALDVPVVRVPALLRAGREVVFRRAGPEISVVIRRLLGEEISDIANELCTTDANIRMRSSRGVRKLRKLVA